MRVMAIALLLSFGTQIGSVSGRRQGSFRLMAAIMIFLSYFNSAKTERSHLAPQGQMQPCFAAANISPISQAWRDWLC